LETPYVGACSELEQQLVAMWEEFLDVRPVGIHDNFFDLGGHSLTALQIISRVIEALKLELPVKALFESPTIAEIGAIIEQNRTKPANDAESARVLCEVEAMTEEEAEKMLAKH
jgi:acyl carrier protein